jgi:hypothetical protein
MYYMFKTIKRHSGLFISMNYLNLCTWLGFLRKVICIGYHSTVKILALYLVSVFLDLT